MPAGAVYARSRPALTNIPHGSRLLRDVAGSFSLTATDKPLPTICASSMWKKELGRILKQKHIVPWAYAGLKHLTSVLCAYCARTHRRVWLGLLVCAHAILLLSVYCNGDFTNTHSIKYLEYIQTVPGILLFVLFAITRSLRNATTLGVFDTRIGFSTLPLLIKFTDCCTLCVVLSSQCFDSSYSDFKPPLRLCPLLSLLQDVQP